MVKKNRLFFFNYIFGSGWADGKKMRGVKEKKYINRYLFSLGEGRGGGGASQSPSPPPEKNKLA